jgi:predicted nucleotidyltransferase
MKPDYLDIVKQIVLLHVPNDAFALFLFGSRAVGNAKLLSGIDIGILGTEPLPMMVKAHLDAELEESIVPFKIDLIDFYQVDNDFKKEALKKILIWNCPKNIKLN